MTNSLETELHKATALTFERLAFVFPSAELAEEEAEAKLEAAVVVDFNGSFDGRLVLAVSGGVLGQLVANMLGQETAPDEDARYDALGELANVICGNVLTGVAGKEKIFLLRAPKRLNPAQLREPGAGQVVHINVGLEGGRAEVVLVLQGAPAHIGGGES